MPSNKHVLVTDDTFELIKNTYQELISNGINIHICDITNLSINEGIIIAKNKILNTETVNKILNLK